MNLPLGCSKRKYRSSSGFTIVELIVVVFIIGVLATILIYAYTGYTQKAKSASLQSDLSDASTALKLFQLHNDNFPITTTTDCNASPDSTTNKCLKLGTGNAIVGYSANNRFSPKTFLLVVNNGSIAYKITENSKPTLASTQPGVTPGAIVELHAAKAKAGTGPGINSPLTTIWTDTSGNGNNGTLTNFAGSPWSGAGTTGDPYALFFTGDNDHTDMPDLGVAESESFTHEAWVRDDGAKLASARWVVRETGVSPIRYGIFSNNGAFYFLTRDATSGSKQIGYGSTYSGDGLWHHVVGVTNGSLIRLYIDGTERGTPIAPAAPSAVSSTWLGALTNSAECWIGGIAVTRIYPFALTATQITSNYNAGSDW